MRRGAHCELGSEEMATTSSHCTVTGTHSIPGMEAGLIINLVPEAKYHVAAGGSREITRIALRMIFRSVERSYGVKGVRLT